LQIAALWPRTIRLVGFAVRKIQRKPENQVSEVAEMASDSDGKPRRDSLMAIVTDGKAWRRSMRYVIAVVIFAIAVVGCLSFFQTKDATYPKTSQQVTEP
jgi:hypothetical protein